MSKPVKRGEGYNPKPTTAKRPSTPTPHPPRKGSQRLRLVYIEFSDESGHEMYNQVQAIENKAQTVRLYFVKAERPASEVWGDDWDDSPAIYNAGPPYNFDLMIKFELGGTYKASGLRGVEPEEEEK